MNRPDLSIIIPVFNEAGSLRELVHRCMASAAQTGKPYEIILVDDASTDATPRLAAELARGPVRHERLPENRGQAGATHAGLGQALGRVVVVLDGDLQDPPELIPALVARLDAAMSEQSAVFAVKTRRADVLWFRIGAALYAGAQGLFAGIPWPRGAGSYCAMPAVVARQIAGLRRPTANLSTLVLALGAIPLTVPYEKSSRREGRSRVGLPGLAREAIASLVLTGAMQRILCAVGIICCLAAAGHFVRRGTLPATLAVLALASLGLAWFVRLNRIRALASAPA